MYKSKPHRRYTFKLDRHDYQTEVNIIFRVYCPYFLMYHQKQNMFLFSLQFYTGKSMYLASLLNKRHLPQHLQYYLGAGPSQGCAGCGSRTSGHRGRQPGHLFNKYCLGILLMIYCRNVYSGICMVDPAKGGGGGGICGQERIVKINEN